MAFGLKFAKTPKAEIDARVSEAARILQLEPLLKRRPRELSGGQRQRVAIGRAIVRKPQVFLFDEPLSNLDAALRINTRIEIAKLHKMLKATIVYVTHDQVEAMTLADKIVVMNKGRIEQSGKPLDLYYKPANIFVAGFIGSPAMNFLGAMVKKKDAVTLVDGQELKLKTPTAAKAGQNITVGFRPEHTTLHGSKDLKFKGTVDIIERLGETGFAHLRLSSGQTIIAEVRGDPGMDIGATTNISLAEEHLHLFDRNGNRF
ncbi:MAG: ATP-binding cassette domain-containing protein [Alphaproteobacteria bacterium]|nr:ATP-binding cassette domain-containing protein [Alphaproteobacteria bacterium]